MTPLRLVVFLGNPGRRFQGTRHNIAWQLAEKLSFYSQLVWHDKFKGIYSSFSGKNNRIFLLKPQIFVNRSGESVQALAGFYKIPAQEIMIVHDEMELDFGCFGVKEGGGLAGHNGLRSIVSRIGSRDFFRFRLGISKQPRGEGKTHVLGRFSVEEEALLPSYLKEAGAVLEDCFSGIVSPKDRPAATIRSGL